ncbi:MAG: hypothetical protein FWE18_01110 [Alphaproteobacteria bacterium]|nr:hypothetical protein [Alphaproteobacteria bacterium]
MNHRNLKIFLIISVVIGGWYLVRIIPGYSSYGNNFIKTQVDSYINNLNTNSCSDEVAVCESEFVYLYNIREGILSNLASHNFEQSNTSQESENMYQVLLSLINFQGYFIKRLSNKIKGQTEETKQIYMKCYNLLHTLDSSRYKNSDVNVARAEEIQQNIVREEVSYISRRASIQDKQKQITVFVNEGNSIDNLKKAILLQAEIIESQKEMIRLQNLRNTYYIEQYNKIR